MPCPQLRLWHTTARYVPAMAAALLASFRP
jgi:hypothetical protein